MLRMSFICVADTLPFSFHLSPFTYNNRSCPAKDNSYYYIRYSLDYLMFGSSIP